MSNMSYCRFENTFNALEECLDVLALDGIAGVELQANQYEKPYIKKLINLCREVAEDYDYQEEEE